MNPYVAIDSPDRLYWYAKLTRKKGSKRLYIKLLNYFGQPPLVRTTGLPDTPINRKMLEPTIDKMNRDIAAETFEFARAFPGEKEETKRFFARREENVYAPQPSDITFRKGFDLWLERGYPNLVSDSARRDALDPLQSRVVPYFEEWTINRITHSAVQSFFRALVAPEGANYPCSQSGSDKTRIKHEPLSAKRLRAILGAFKKVWKLTCDEHQWELASPFEGINKYITELTTKKECQVNVVNQDDEELADLIEKLESDRDDSIKVLLFSEYIRILDHMDPLIKPAVELMLLTGMIPSEIGALKNAPMDGDYFIPKLSLSRGNLHSFLKTPYRMRQIPITKAVRRVLDVALAQAQGALIFRGRRSKFFTERVLRYAWYKACDAAGVERVVPYGIRHTFVANLEVLGIPKYKVVALAGHADKSMVDKVYGKYREGIEHEHDIILGYYGEDFVDWKDKSATLSREKMADSWESFGKVMS